MSQRNRRRPPEQTGGRLLLRPVSYTHLIAAVSTTCMREGIVLYDEAGREIWACANVDARSDDEVGELIRMNPELEKEIYRESGRAPRA